MFNFFKEKLTESISKIKKTFGFDNEQKIPAEKLEEILLNMNFSCELTKKIINKIVNNNDWQKELYVYLESILNKANYKEDDTNRIIILVGINGSGKTTTTIKIAKSIKQYHPLVVPADTFRAAAKDQLISLAKENNIDYLSSSATNPASVIYDAYNISKNNQYKKIIIDTAGRIHQNENLLKELEKTIHVTKKYFGEKDCTVYLVLDGLQGKNLFEQTTLFNEKIKIDGIILTKLDSGIKPGIIFSIVEKYQLPIVYLGYGQQNTPLVKFNKEEFLKSFLL